jgi:hypothetical protein
MSAIGQIPQRAEITSVSIGFPCVITTTEEHGFNTFDFVRLTNLNGMMPSPQNGADQLNNKRYRIVVVDTTSFKIQNPITFEYIDSTNFPPYNQGGKVNLVPTNFIFYGEE